MAQQNINTGTAANDDTGDSLRDAFLATEANFTELYADNTTILNTLGWGFYVDDVTSNQTINATPSKLTINGSGSTSESGYLPLEIRGSGELWDSSTNKITPISIGDSYDVRLDLTIDSKTGSPTLLDLVLDIGGTSSPTINIVTMTINLTKTPPYSISVGIPIFSLSTFKTNGGQLFLSTDTGTVDISSRALLLKRDFNGTI